MRNKNRKRLVRGEMEESGNYKEEEKKYMKPWNKI